MLSMATFQSRHSSPLCFRLSLPVKDAKIPTLSSPSFLDGKTMASGHPSNILLPVPSALTQYALPGARSRLAANARRGSLSCTAPTITADGPVFPPPYALSELKLNDAPTIYTSYRTIQLLWFAGSKRGSGVGRCV